MVSSRYSAMALDSNSEMLSSIRSTGTFLCGEMARNQSGRLSGSMWRNSNAGFLSGGSSGARGTLGHVLKLTSRYFAMADPRDGVRTGDDGTRGNAEANRAPRLCHLRVRDTVPGGGPRGGRRSAP